MPHVGGLPDWSFWGMVKHAIEDLDPARAFYVSSAGDDSAEGSVSSPWATVSKVNAQTLYPGDRVLFNRGDSWAENLIIPSSGVPNRPITFGAYGSGARPVIGATGDGLSGSSKDYIVVEDISVQNWTNRGIWNNGGQNWTIQRNYVTGGNNTNPVHGIRCNGVNLGGIVIKDNQVGTIGTADNESIYRAGIILQGTDGAVVENNVVETAYTYGILSSFVSGNSNTQQVRIVDNIVKNGKGGIVVWNTDDALVARNHIHDCDGLGIGVTFASLRARIFDNHIHDLGKSTSTWNGIDINGAALNGYCAGNRVYAVFRHCLVIDGGASGWSIVDNTFDASAGSGAGLTDGRIIGIAIRDPAALTDLFEDRNRVIRHASWAYYGASGIGDGTLYDLDTWRTTVGQGAHSTSEAA